MATKLTKKQKEALTDKIAGLIKNSPALRMTTDSSVNELNINQISGELNRIHYRAIGKDLPTVINIPASLTGYEIIGIGTVYGGELNIETGVLTVTYNSVDLGTLTWQYDVDFSDFSTPTWENLYRPSSTEMPHALASGYQPIVYHRSTTLDKVFMIGRPGINWIRFKNLAYTNATDFKASVSGVMLVYEMETPETYTLTPAQMIQLIDQL